MARITEEPFDELMRGTLSGRYSRRQMLKRATALGLGAPAVAALMRANAVAAQGTPAAAKPAGWSLTSMPQLRTDLKGQKITTMLAAASDPDRPWEVAVIKKFSDATGIQVTNNPGPNTTDDRLTKMLQLFAAKSSDLDITQIDVVDTGVLAPYALDLKALQDLASQQLKAIVDNNTINGVLMAMPWFTDAGIFYYRTDLLQKYSLQPPTTWDEMQTSAKTIMTGEQKTNKNFYGFSFQGSAYEGLTCDAIEWEASNGGGTIIDNTGKVVVNNPQTAAIFEMAHGWVNGISPTSVTTFTEQESVNLWAPGNAAFLRNWPYAYAVSKDPTQSKVAGKFDVSVLPMGSGDGAKHVACLGGWQMMVSKFSKAPDAAIEFLKFMCSKEVQKSFSIERSHLPTNPTLYDDPECIQANPFYPKLKPIFTGGAVARPSRGSGRFYPQVSAAYYTAVHNILTGSGNAKDQLSSLESQLKTILAQAS